MDDMGCIYFLNAVDMSKIAHTGEAYVAEVKYVSEHVYTHFIN